MVGGGRSPREALIGDAELVDAFERGEGRACELLYDRLIDVVEATLFRVLGRRDEAHDDLVQTAFEQIVSSLSRRQFARACSLSSWAATVTAHLAFNTIRSRTRERRVLDLEHDGDAAAQQSPSTADVERDASTRQELERVRLHLSSMNPDRATTLFLHDVLGHELSEIAGLMQVSIAAAQSRLVRGRRELQALLDADSGSSGRP